MILVLVLFFAFLMLIIANLGDSPIDGRKPALSKARKVCEHKFTEFKVEGHTKAKICQRCYCQEFL